MTTPLVSILIPAFRTTWLDLAIASAVAQTVRDVEIIVSDDTQDERVANIVQKWSDPRIRYMKNPNRGLICTNRNNLIAHARGRYLKFLFDDDFLLPHSIESLLSAVESSGAKLAFHSRHVVDGDGCVLASPQLVTGTAPQRLSRDFFFNQLIAHAANLIGEPSNILIDTAGIPDLQRLFTIQQRHMGFLSDVALYANFMRLDLGIVGVAQFGSAFRVHAQQTSGAGYAGYSAGLFEWDLFRRWSAECGYMSRDAFEQGREMQRQMYQTHVARFPELAYFNRLNAQAPQAHFLTRDFMEALNLGYSTIALRKFARAR